MMYSQEIILRALSILTGIQSLMILSVSRKFRFAIAFPVTPVLGHLSTLLQWGIPYMPMVRFIIHTDQVIVMELG